MQSALKRVIPVLGIENRRLIKTMKFGNPTYIGDPINAIKVFNEKAVDEIVVVDIRASLQGREPDYVHLREMAGEAFMPMGYGGGVDHFDLAQKVFQCGIEKVVLNSVLFKNPKIVTQIANHYGAQSVVISLDYKKNVFGKLKPVFISGKKSLNISLVDFAKQMEQSGAGEIILHNVDREGTFSGYDLDTLAEVVNATGIPVVPLGGARNIADMSLALQAGAHAMAASGLFVFKNNDRNSILINYQSIQ